MAVFSCVGYLDEDGELYILRLSLFTALAAPGYSSGLDKKGRRRDHCGVQSAANTLSMSISYALPLFHLVVLC